MAKLSSDKTYVTVQSGDTLYSIAKKYGNGKTYQQLAKENGISNPNKIYVGQKIYLNGKSGTSTGSNSNTASSKPKDTVEFTDFGLMLPGTGGSAKKRLFARWKWDKPSKFKGDTEYYLVEWTYTYDNKKWHTGTLTNNTIDKVNPSAALSSEYDVPDGALKVRLRVRPVAKVKENSKKEERQWTANWSEYKVYENETPLPIPSAPEVKIEKDDGTDEWRLTATVSDLEESVISFKATHIEFHVVKNDKVTHKYSNRVSINNVGYTASWTCPVEPGNEYKVRARGYRKDIDEYSDWTAFTENYETVPVTPAGITDLRLYKPNDSNYAVYVEWTKVNGSEITYDVECSEYDDFKMSTANGSTEDNTPNLVLTFSEGQGKKLYFRVRAKNASGESDWTEPKSLTVGTKPSAPTTWSSVSSAVLDTDEVYLYWIHNSEDESYQSKAEIMLEVYDVSTNTLQQGIKLTYENDYTSMVEDKVDRTSYVRIDHNGNLYFSDSKDPDDADDPTIPYFYPKAEGELTGDKFGDYDVYMYEYRHIFQGETTIRTTYYYTFVDDGRARYVELKLNENTEEGQPKYVIVPFKLITGDLRWTVRTKGVLDQWNGVEAWSDWSITRTVKLRRDPTITAMLEDDSGGNIGVNEDKPLRGFPLYILGDVKADHQLPISYNVLITANEDYETVDDIGNAKTVLAGQAVYSKIFDTSNNLFIELGPGDVDFENGMSYTVRVTVTTDAGLTVTSESKVFSVSWTDPGYYITGEVGYDPVAVTTNVRPYCETPIVKRYLVNQNGTIYTKIVGEPIGTWPDSFKHTYNHYYGLLLGENTYIPTEDELVNTVFDGVPNGEIYNGHEVYAETVDGVTRYYYIVDEEVTYQYGQLTGDRVEGSNEPVWYGALPAQNETDPIVMGYYCISGTNIYAVDAKEATYTATTDLLTRIPFGDPVSPPVMIDGHPVYMALMEADGDIFSTEYEIVYYYEVEEITPAVYTGEINYLVTPVRGSSGTVYRLTDTVITGNFISQEVPGALTTPDVEGQPSYQVHKYTTRDNETVYFASVEEENISRVLMSVYRREFDGSFTPLATNLDGANNIAVPDPHPALDYARYRIVAKDKVTGSITFQDMNSYPIDCKDIIIQWDDAWTPFDVVGDVILEEPSWSGSMLRLPYNIDVSENTDPEVELIEYIGRADPVSYYGTQRRHTATWNTVIPKSDKETLYALRRLANWFGDVYVREPSGIGYWANVKVSFSQKHLDLTIPVTFDITRVEGGI